MSVLVVNHRLGNRVGALGSLSGLPINHVCPWLPRVQEALAAWKAYRKVNPPTFASSVLPGFDGEASSLILTTRPPRFAPLPSYAQGLEAPTTLLQQLLVGGWCLADSLQEPLWGLASVVFGPSFGPCLCVCVCLYRWLVLSPCPRGW